MRQTGGLVAPCAARRQVVFCGIDDPAATGPPVACWRIGFPVLRRNVLDKGWRCSSRSRWAETPRSFAARGSATRCRAADADERLIRPFNLQHSPTTQILCLNTPSFVWGSDAPFFVAPGNGCATVWAPLTRRACATAWLTTRVLSRGGQPRRPPTSPIWSAPLTSMSSCWPAAGRANAPRKWSNEHFHRVHLDGQRRN